MKTSDLQAAPADVVFAEVVTINGDLFAPLFSHRLQVDLNSGWLHVEVTNPGGGSTWYSVSSHLVSWIRWNPEPIERVPFVG